MQSALGEKTALWFPKSRQAPGRPGQAERLPRGSLLAASGPFVFFFFFPTLVGTGGSYFFFLSYSGQGFHGKKKIRILTMKKYAQMLGAQRQRGLNAS